jgi:hypothetical protein
VSEEQRVGERPDAARHGRDRGRDRTHRLEVDVADDRPVDDVDPDVDDDDAAPDHVAPDQSRMAGGDDQDLGILDMARKVARPRVADRHRRVLADEQKRRRHAHDRRSADDDRPLPLDLDGGPAKDLDGGVGGRRKEPVIAEAEQPGVERVDPVDVLRRIDRVDDAPQPDGRRQRHLDDDPVDRRIVVERPDGLDEACLRRLTVDLDETAIDPDLLAAPQDLLQIHHRRRVAPADHDGEDRRPTVTLPIRGDVLADGPADLGRDRASLEETSAAPRHRGQALMPGAVPGSRRCAHPRGPCRRSPRG